MRKLAFFLVIALSGSAMAFTECTYEVESVFIDTQIGGGEMVWLQLRVPGGSPNIAIFRDSSSPESLRGRIYTMALTSFTTSKKVVVRYPENNAICAAQTTPRGDFLGLRLING